MPPFDTETLVGVLLTNGFCLDLPGSFKLRALGITRDDVSIKKISNRNMISVNDDMLNCALTLLFFFNPKTLLFTWLSSNDGSQL